MSAPSASEKRRCPRVSFKKGVKLRSQDNAVLDAQLAQDLSKSGIRVNCGSFVPVGAKATISVQLENESRVMDVPGTVVWVKYLPHLDTYQLGMEFAADTIFAQWKIAQFVYKNKGE